MLRFGARAPLFLLTTGCVYHAFTPAIRPETLESPGVLDRGRTAIVAEGAGHGTSREGSLDTGTLRVRRGLGPSVEGSLEATYTHNESIDASAVALRVGVKKCLAKQSRRGKSFRDCIVALVGGVGGGTFDGGGLFGGDAGVVVGWENPYFVPFFAARVDFAVPVAPRSVYEGDFCDGLGWYGLCRPVYEEPRPTFAWGGLLGFRVPIPPGPGTRSPRAAALGGVQLLQRLDGVDAEASLAFTAAVEIGF